MRLARAAVADQNHRLGLVDVLPLGQLPHQARWNLRGLGKIELVESLHPGQVGLPQPPFHGSSFPFFHLGRQKCFEVTDVGLVPLDGLVRQPQELRTHGRKAQRFAVLPDRTLQKGCSLFAHCSTSSPTSNWS